MDTDGEAEPEEIVGPRRRAEPGWDGVQGALVSYAVVFRAPLDRTADIERALLSLSGVKIVYRRAAATHLYITDKKPEEGDERHGEGKEAGP